MHPFSIALARFNEPALCLVKQSTSCFFARILSKVYNSTIFLTIASFILKAGSHLAS